MDLSKTAVIPALRVYLKVAAVKKPVADIIKIKYIDIKKLVFMCRVLTKIEFELRTLETEYGALLILRGKEVNLRGLTVNKLGCSKQAL